ncbi:MAG: aminomethyl transferase family protein [Deltaproteobacteria bacterium]|nr:aminomethyl transferase family protein [Deltaproteobacteria bacterium]
MPIGTPFHSRTSALCQSYNWRHWSGYLAASSYDVLHDNEYIDVSPLYKYDVKGKDALRLVNRLSTRDAAKCAVHQAMYTCLCDDQGKVIQDGTVFRFAEETFRFHLADPSLRWLRLNAAGLEVELEDVSERIAALALQGPTSRDILKRLADTDIDRINYFRFASATLGGIPAVVSRTGYTGDLGYEIWVSAEHAEPLWDLLMAAGGPYGLVPVGMLALDMARLEAGFVLIEVDYTSSEKALVALQKFSPFEIGLGWTVNLEKESFVGHAALRAEKERGSLRQLVGLEIDWEEFERLFGEVGLPAQAPTSAWRSRVPVFRDGRQIGRATTGCWSPTLKKYIALAIVRHDCATLGLPLQLEVAVEDEKKRVGANVMRLPFFDPERKRARFYKPSTARTTP